MASANKEWRADVVTSAQLGYIVTLTAKQAADHPVHALTLGALVKLTKGEASDLIAELSK